MSLVHWQFGDGSRVTADITDGTNLMEAALAHAIGGVVGECGGCLSCATCHVVVAQDWVGVCPPLGDTEDAMLDIVSTPRQPASRLSCQLVAGPALDGIVLHVPV